MHVHDAHPAGQQQRHVFAPRGQRQAQLAPARAVTVRGDVAHLLALEQAVFGIDAHHGRYAAACVQPGSYHDDLASQEVLLR
jgi:hypothetical protein